ncbi:MAG: hypothetical protein Q9170_000887 [Blastenia crenularia]
MNWTGGSLSRSRKQNASLSVVQKRHFAKARAKLLNQRQPRSRPYTDYEDDVTSPSTPPDRLRKRRANQLTLDEFENVGPVVRQLQSIRPRHASVSDARHRSSALQHSSPSSSHLLTRSSRPNRPDPSRLGPTHQGKVRATNENTASPAGTPLQDELDAKRRELLGTSDWMGLEKLKPVKIKFPDIEDRDLIGKRRRVKTDQYEAIRTTDQHRRPTGNAYEKLQMLQRSSNILSSPEEISIHIGCSGRGSSARQRDNSGSGSSHRHRAHTSEEMLFDDQEPAKAAVPDQSSTQSSFQRSVNASDDMLFDREWSGIASPLGAEATTTPEGSYHQKPHEIFQYADNRANALAAYTISSADETEYSEESLPAPNNSQACHEPEKPDLGRHQLWQEERTLRQKSSAPAQTEVAPPGSRRNTSQSQGSRPELQYHTTDQSLHEQERRALHVSQKVSDGHPNQSLATHHKTNVNERSFAQATAKELADLFPVAEFSTHHLKWAQEKSAAINQENIDTQVKIKKNEKGKVKETSSPKDVPVLFPQSPAKDPRIAVPVATEEISQNPSAPSATTPTTPPPNPQIEMQQPVDPSAEEDEIIWRTFVFGTDNLEEDWTFENPIPEPKPALKPRPPSSSSLIHPIIDSPNHRNKESSPVQQTHPSLRVEASSSSAPYTTSSPNPISHSFSPSAATAEAPTISLPSIDPRSSSPGPRTQHSIQVQPSTTSSDELALSSPVRMAPPAVTFKKPRRYVGERVGVVGPLRLGLEEGRRGRRKGKGDGERGRGRGRRELRGEVEEVMEGDGVEDADEIVDD